MRNRGANVPRGMPLPLVLMPLWMQIIDWASEFPDVRRDLVSVELFAGEMQITRSLISDHNARAVAFDKAYFKDDSEDLCSQKGFRKAIFLVLRIAKGGSLWAAPVCSSWGWVGRAATKRSMMCPGGFVWNNKVRQANRMVVLLSMIFLLAFSRGVDCWLEQPSSSVMKAFSPMKEILTTFMPFHQQVWLSAYGAQSHKPLTIWSSNACVALLARKKPKAVFKKLYKMKNGRTQGVVSDLKQSAAYPVAFGVAVANIIMKSSKP